MADNRQNFEEVLKIFAQADSLLADGHSIEDICGKLSVAEDDLRAWANHLALPPNPGDVLSSSSIPEAVFPVFAAERLGAPLGHIGSGVVVRIGDGLFALTAAHVTDHANGDGVLFMPAADGIVPMTGGFSHNPVPEHGSRAEDTGDMAYCRLSDEWRHKLHPAIKPLSVTDLLLTDDIETGDIFTFVGYPWRKTTVRRRTHETERLTYTGHAFSPDVYERLGYSRFVHVLIRMRRKKTYSTLYESHQIAPHPQGISGGAVIAWPWTFEDRFQSSNMRLAAIGHTYHAQDHCMAATRIIPYMMAIVRNNPHLAVHFMNEGNIAEGFGAFLAEKMKSMNPSNVPTAIGISWYTPQTYQQCVEIFDDGADLPDTFDEWQRMAERAEQQIVAQGVNVVRVGIDPVTFSTWCKANGFARIDKHARMAFGNAKALKTLESGT